MELPEGKTRLKISWERFHEDTKALAQKLRYETRLQSPFIGIIAVSRGGLIPAGIIAYELGIKFVDTYCLSTYGADKYKTEFLDDLKLPLEHWNGNSILVIDDLVDTGESFKHIAKRHGRCHFAAVYAKPAGRSSAQTYLTSVDQETWIEFPWD